MVLRIRLRNSGIDEYLAKFDWGSPRKPNVACFVIEVKFSSFENFREIFSGNVVVETLFYDDNLLVSTSKVRIFYDWRSFIKQGISNISRSTDKALISTHLCIIDLTLNIYFNNTRFIWNYIVKENKYEIFWESIMASTHNIGYPDELSLQLIKN